MAKFQAKPFKLEDINNGNQFEKEGITPNAINAPIEASALMQSLATNQPNNSEVANVGTPKVEIESTADGYRFKFSNLRGQQGVQGEKGETGATGETGPQGATGETGKAGRGISSIDLVYIQGKKNRYKITYTDGTSSFFTVTNGEDGADGTNGKDGEDGADGTNGKDGEDGADGKSAYDIWLEQGNTGSEADFLESLKGKDGADGTTTTVTETEVVYLTPTFTDYYIDEYGTMYLYMRTWEWNEETQEWYEVETVQILTKRDSP